MQMISCCSDKLLAYFTQLAKVSSSREEVASAWADFRFSFWFKRNQNSCQKVDFCEEVLNETKVVKLSNQV